MMLAIISAAASFFLLPSGMRMPAYRSPARTRLVLIPTRTNAVVPMQIFQSNERSRKDKIKVSIKVKASESKPRRSSSLGPVALMQLVVDELKAAPGWYDGKGVSMQDLSEKIYEWENDEDDKVFSNAIDMLEEAGWLRVEEVDSEDESDMLYSAAAGDFTGLAAIENVASPDNVPVEKWYNTADDSEAGSEESNVKVQIKVPKVEIPETSVSSKVESLMGLIRTALDAIPGWIQGQGITLSALSDQIDEWESEDDDDDFYDAIDLLENVGWLRVVNGEDDDVLFAVPQAPREYDSRVETILLTNLRRSIASLKKYGMSKEDANVIPELSEECKQLAKETKNSPMPKLANDPGLIGDWQLVATTSPKWSERFGLTGLARAPFTDLDSVFVSFLQNRKIIAKEILRIAGRPTVLNELRGEFQFDETGDTMQEQYGTADISGVKDSPDFVRAEVNTTRIMTSQDGSIRIQNTGNGFNIYRKLGVGELFDYLKERGLPIAGGTIPSAMTDKEERAKAYPYLDDDEDEGGGWNPFKLR
jgi:hypothetical protein